MACITVFKANLYNLVVKQVKFKVIFNIYFVYQVKLKGMFTIIVYN